MYNKQSSANSQTWELTQSGKSLIWHKKKSGPRTALALLWRLLQLLLICLSQRKDFDHLRRFPLIVSHNFLICGGVYRVEHNFGHVHLIVSLLTFLCGQSIYNRESNIMVIFPTNKTRGPKGLNGHLMQLVSFQQLSCSHFSF